MRDHNLWTRTNAESFIRNSQETSPRENYLRDLFTYETLPSIIAKNFSPAKNLGLSITDVYRVEQGALFTPPKITKISYRTFAGNFWSCTTEGASRILYNNHNPISQDNRMDPSISRPNDFQKYILGNLAVWLSILCEFLRVRKIFLASQLEEASRKSIEFPAEEIWRRIKTKSQDAFKEKINVPV